MLREIDEAMLNRFERFSHWTQRAFGWSSGHWAKTVTVVTAVSYSVDVAANNPESDATWEDIEMWSKNLLAKADGVIKCE